jgi:hypothetical protein
VGSNPTAGTPRTDARPAPVRRSLGAGPVGRHAAGGCGTAYGVPDTLVVEPSVLDVLDESVVDGLDVDVDELLLDVVELGEPDEPDVGGLVVTGGLVGGLVVSVGAGVVGVHVGGGAVVGDVGGGGTGRLVDDVGGAVRAPGSGVPGGISIGSPGALDGGDVGAQPSGIDPSGIETVPDGAPPPEPPKGMTDEKASMADAAVRAQLTPSGVLPPL